MMETHKSYHNYNLAFMSGTACYADNDCFKPGAHNKHHYLRKRVAKQLRCWFGFKRKRLTQTRADFQDAHQVACPRKFSGGEDADPFVYQFSPTDSDTEGELHTGIPRKFPGGEDADPFVYQSSLVLTISKQTWGRNALFEYPPTIEELRSRMHPKVETHIGENPADCRLASQNVNEFCLGCTENWINPDEETLEKLVPAVRHSSYDSATLFEVEDDKRKLERGYFSKVSHLVDDKHVSEDNDYGDIKILCRESVDDIGRLTEKCEDLEQQSEAVDFSTYKVETSETNSVSSVQPALCSSFRDEARQQESDNYIETENTFTCTEVKLDAPRQLNVLQYEPEKGTNIANDAIPAASKPVSSFISGSSKQTKLDQFCTCEDVHECVVEEGNVNLSEQSGCMETEINNSNNDNGFKFTIKKATDPAAVPNMYYKKYATIQIGENVKFDSSSHSCSCCPDCLGVSPQHKDKLTDTGLGFLTSLVTGKYSGSYFSKMTSYMLQEDMCHPRFADEQRRLETLENCSERQLRGYQAQELARVGWYFNGRALLTFCCGMEMPQAHRGEPLDVHRGLSPHCSFAVHVQSSAAVAFAGEVQKVAERVQSLEVAGAAADLSVSTQATDDPFGSYGLASDAFEDGQHDLFVGYQETQPGDHWLSEQIDYTLNFSMPVEDTSYREGLVTNRTPSAAEVWQPFSGVSEEPDGAARPAEFQQNSFTSAGRVFVRSPASQSSQGVVRLVRDLQADTNRPHSPPAVNFEEQFEMMSGPPGDGERPRHPQFAFPSVRIWTYEGWQRDHPQRPPVLADAGLFYAGYGDCVLCYSCGIGLRHWTRMDNAWIEHARWRPTCFYVRRIQGVEFITVAQEMTRNNRHPSYEEVRLEANRRQQAIEQEHADPPPVPAGELNLLCKVCYTHEMCIVLMPCRHLAVCEQCSGHVFACPICRGRVESSFRADFG